MLITRSAVSLSDTVIIHTHQIHVGKTQHRIFISVGGWRRVISQDGLEMLSGGVHRGGKMSKGNTFSVEIPI